MAFLSGWAYRKLITINGSTAGPQVNYQMKITLNSGVGIDSSTNIYLNNHAKLNFGDVLFTQTDGTTLLSFWIDSSTTTSSSTDVWVKISSIPESPNTITVYLYYGNPSASPMSNGTNTFIIFDDFSSDVWTNVGGATHTVSNNQMSCSNIATEGRVQHPTSVSGGFNFHFRVVSQATTWYSFEVFSDGINAVSGYLIDATSDGTDAGILYKSVTGSWIVLDNSHIWGGVQTAPFNADFRLYNGTFTLLVNGVQKNTFSSDTTFTSGKLGYRQVLSRNKVVSDVYVRNFVNPEPTFTTIGNEEILIQGRVFISIPKLAGSIT